MFALLLFMVAFFIWGLKSTAVISQKKLASIFATGIKDVIEFGDKLFPPNVKEYSLQLQTLGNNDTITVNRKEHKVYSSKNFTYTYKGRVIKCYVSYDGSNYYTITCEVQ